MSRIRAISAVSVASASLSVDVSRVTRPTVEAGGQPAKATEHGTRTPEPRDAPSLSDHAAVGQGRSTASLTT